MTISQRSIRSCGLSSRGTPRSRSRSSPPMPFTVRGERQVAAHLPLVRALVVLREPAEHGVVLAGVPGQDGSFARHHGSPVMSRPPFQRIHHSAVSLQAPSPA